MIELDSSTPSVAASQAATSNPHRARADRGAESPSAFAQLGLSSSLVRQVARAGYDAPTPIQAEAIPPLLKGRDVLGCAQTGTGKTAAFALPILDRLVSGRRKAGRPARGSGPAPIRALVLAPTRELAAQIRDSFETYGADSGLRAFAIFGGVSKGPQVSALRRGIDVLVATPGRLLDLMGEGVVRLGDVSTFVLDEADRMLDMGFVNDVRRISRALPEQRQTLLFSATMPREIEALARSLLQDPVRIAVDPVASTGEPIAQSVCFVETKRKVALLLELLDRGEVESALVFTRTKHMANRLSQKLERAGVQADAIHGNKSQAARERALASLKAGRTRVVVATDVAARGIDVKDLSHVVNYELPVDAESYVHRVGRTGRAGRTGVALSLCASDERSRLRAIERLTGQKIRVEALPEGFDPGEPSAAPSDGGRGRTGGRPGAGRGNRSRTARGNGAARQGRGSGAGRSNGGGREGRAQTSGDRGRRSQAADTRGNGSDATRGARRNGSGATRGNRPNTSSAKRSSRPGSRSARRRPEAR